MSADDAFRRQLDLALNEWVSEGLIKTDQRDRLRSRYRLDELPASTNSRFAAVLLGIGGILVGLGLITFVAANWAAIPRSVRAIGVLMLTLAFNTAGFVWWTTEGERLRLRPRLRNLGSAMLLVGQLGWGASIALMAQWVQISGSPAGLFAVWGSSVLLMAFSIRHVPSGALGAVLVTIAYWIWQFDGDHAPWLNAVMTVAPLLAPLILIALAYWCRSRWLFALGAIATSIFWLGAISLALNAAANRAASNTFTWAFISWCAALWGGSLVHQHYVWPSLASAHSPSSRLDAFEDGSLDFAPIAQALATLSLLAGLGLGSFRLLTEEWAESLADAPNFLSGIWLSPVSGLLVFVGLGLAILGSMSAWQRHELISGASAAMNWAVGIALVGFLLFVTGAVAGKYAVILFNVLLFATASTLAWHGLQIASRWHFWLGLLSLASQILFRFFEYDTGLLLKSLVLIVCGVSVILAGLQFERVIHAPSPRRPQP